MNANPPIPPRAFTLKANAVTSKIILDVSITRRDQTQPQTAVKAVVSTGAERSLISPVVVEALALEAVDGPGGQPCYPADIFLPNNMRCAGVAALLDPRLTDAAEDCVIGMDVLAIADVSLSSAGNATMFSFRAPAQGGVDYVAEHNAPTAAAPPPPPTPPPTPTPPQTPVSKSARHVVPAGREERCPCGSGKKHKNCCGKLNPGGNRRRRK